MQIQMYVYLCICVYVYTNKCTFVWKTNKRRIFTFMSVKHVCKMYYCIIIHVDTQTHTIEKIIHVLFMYVSVLRRLRLCLVYTCTHVLRLCLEKKMNMHVHYIIHVNRDTHV